MLERLKLATDFEFFDACARGTAQQHFCSAERERETINTWESDLHDPATTTRFCLLTTIIVLESRHHRFTHRTVYDSHNHPRDHTPATAANNTPERSHSSPQPSQCQQ